MEGQTNERWKELCAQVTVEQDPAKLIALVKKINGLLEQQGQRLKAASNASDEMREKALPVGQG